MSNHGTVWRPEDDEDNHSDEACKDCRVCRRLLPLSKFRLTKGDSRTSKCQDCINDTRSGFDVVANAHKKLIDDLRRHNDQT